MGAPHKDETQMNEYRRWSLMNELPPRPRILELGVQSGASLQMWQELWPDAEVIVGVDCDQGAVWPAGTVRVVTYQDSEDLPRLLAKAAGPGPFDLIVDDASHLPGPSLATWRMLWPLVDVDGRYVWEDWGAGITNPGVYGSPATQLAAMAAKVERRQATMRILPGMTIMTRL